ncbi:MAG TPA: COX aromatic rich motif-containing protein [Candidatus Saccharimonadales bacterium]|nr:COX aromatic rich motif-containing protein [Candidatus Saccharimonadales bacterium]
MKNLNKFALWTGPILILIIVSISYFHKHSVAVLDPQGPVSRSEYHLIVITVLLSLIVVIPVFVLLFYITSKYRENNGSTYAPELDHNGIIEAIWWLIPSILILILSVIIWDSSHQLDPFKPVNANARPLHIQVIALQWKWLFVYPEQQIATLNYVQFPAQTPIDFDITADAPMNSFWIPQLGSQIYAMPGMSTQLHLLADRSGNFRGSSANISGQGFADMNFIAHASSQIDFDNWIGEVKQSPNNLNLNSYNYLADNKSTSPMTFYAFADPQIYPSVITKYMGPMSNMHMVGSE